MRVGIPQQREKHIRLTPLPNAVTDPKSMIFALKVILEVMLIATQLHLVLNENESQLEMSIILIANESQLVLNENGSQLASNLI